MPDDSEPSRVRRPHVTAESSQGWSGDYGEATRNHYLSDDVADQYAQALAARWMAPGSAVVTWLERRAIRRALRTLGVMPTGTGRAVLDIAAGTGKLTDLLRAIGPYVAVDISEAMLRRIAASEAMTVGDALALPVRGGAVDVCVTLRLYHRVPVAVMEPMLAEAVRVARSGVVVSYAGDSRWPAVHRVIRLVTRRPDSRAAVLTSAAFEQIASRVGARVVSDRSISASLTAERVAAMTPVDPQRR